MDAMPFDANYNSDVDLRATMLGMDGNGSYDTALPRFLVYFSWMHKCTFGE